MSPFIKKYATILAKTTDKAPIDIKKAEQAIIDYANSFKKTARIDPFTLRKVEEKEYGYIMRKGKEFDEADLFTSNSSDHIYIKHAFGNIGEMTEEMIRGLKGTIITHNHPNFSRFSIDDIKMFVKYGLKEIRAINTNGVVYSLQLKSNKIFTPEEFLLMERTLKESRIKWYDDFFKENADTHFNRANVLPKYIENLQEEFWLTQIKNRVEYNIYR